MTETGGEWTVFLIDHEGPVVEPELPSITAFFDDLVSKLIKLSPEKDELIRKGLRPQLRQEPITIGDLPHHRLYKGLPDVQQFLDLCTLYSNYVRLANYIAPGCLKQIEDLKFRGNNIYELVSPRHSETHLIALPTGPLQQAAHWAAHA